MCDKDTYIVFGKCQTNKVIKENIICFYESTYMNENIHLKNKLKLMYT